MIYSPAILVLRVIALVQQVAMRRPVQPLPDSAKRLFARIEGQVQIGALFPIHKKSASEGCDHAIREQYGIQRMEVAMKTIDDINANARILPNVRLGLDIRDSCWTERIAMEQTIEFVREVLGDPGNGDCEKQNDAADTQTAANLAAVVGPGSSAVTIAVQNLLQVFRIPQIGYSATSTTLSDRNDFRFFMRVVPSDAWQARALVHIVKYFNWNYVAVVYSDGNYGEKGFEALKQTMNAETDPYICIAQSEKIKTTAPAAEFKAVLQKLSKKDPRPQVVLCFCEGEANYKFFRTIKEMEGNDINGSFSFQWIGSDSWADREDVVENVEEFAAGSLSLRIYSPQVNTFLPYYASLTTRNPRNPWWTAFWQQRFNCSLSNNHSGPRMPPCTRNENLTEGFKPDPKLIQVVNSIYTIAYALDSMYNKTCGNSSAQKFQAEGLCEDMKPLNGTKLLREMRHVRFTDSSGEEIYFDANGDPPARYEILNYQGKDNGYVKIGDWSRGLYKDENFTERENITLSVRTEAIMWSTEDKTVPNGRCNEECKVGYYKVTKLGECCWACHQCLPHQILLDAKNCIDCANGTWPNSNRTACEVLPIEYLRWSDPPAIVVIVLSCAGILATMFSTFQFIKFNTTPVVKSTTRELSYIILVGIFICYSMTFVIVAKPSTLSCYLVRILPGVAFAMIYGALLTKTNRIARILAGSKKRILTKKPRFLTTASQVVITWLLVGVEAIIVTAVLIYEPALAQEDYRFQQRVLLVCKTSMWGFLAPFGWDLFLISLCTLYAVKTRNLPENFNEAKFIGFTMYTTCIIWLAFLTVYVGSENKAITMCLSFSLSATVALILLFFPKLYILIFVPSKNNREYCATHGKEMRVTYGPSQSTAQSRTFSAAKASSKGSSGTESDSGIGRLKKGFRESVHVPVPPKPGEKIRNLSEFPGSIGEGPIRIASGEAQTSALKSVHYQKELSIIEESLLSQDSQPQSMPSANGTDKFLRPVACQTDWDLLEVIFNEWLKRSFSGEQNSFSNGAEMPLRPGLRRRQKNGDHRRATNSGLFHTASESPLIREDSSDDEKGVRGHRRGRRFTVESESEDPELFADLLTSTFQTFLGTALPASEDGNRFYITTESKDDTDSTDKGLIGHTVEAAIETVISTALPDVAQRRKSLQKEASFGSLTGDIQPAFTDGNTASPKLQRRGTFLERLGCSIRQKMRQTLGGKHVYYQKSPSPAKSEDEGNNDKSTNDPFSSTRPPLTEEEIPTTRPAFRQHSDATDSGVVIQPSSLDIGLSQDSERFDTDSSKEVSAKSKPNDSVHLILHSTPNGEGDTEFHRLLHQEGIETIELSESTLV